MHILLVPLYEFFSSEETPTLLRRSELNGNLNPPPLPDTLQYLEGGQGAQVTFIERYRAGLASGDALEKLLYFFFVAFVEAFVFDAFFMVAEYGQFFKVVYLSYGTTTEHLDVLLG